MNSQQTLKDAMTAVRHFSDLTTKVTDADLGKQTPNADWDVSQLLDHAHVAALNFKTMAEGGEAQWDLQAPDTQDRGADLRATLSDLADAWSADGAKAEAAGMAVPEFAIHGWDLAQAIGADASGLDDGVAERAHEFMKSQLTDDQRGPSFGKEQQAPEGASALDALAAFSGRSVDKS